MKIAVMDFSSTALSLLVADVSRESIEPLIGLRRSVSLIDYMSKKGRLSERGIEKVIEAVMYLEDAAKKVGADRIVLIATASMRLISNYSEVQESIYRATGLSFDILDGHEEAFADAEANREYASLGEYNLGNYDKVIPICEKIIAASPEDSTTLLNAYTTMGDMYYKTGEHKKAFRSYDSALSINPDYLPVLNNYAYFLSVEKKQLKKDVSVLEKALSKIRVDKVAEEDMAGVRAAMQTVETELGAEVQQ